MATSSWSPFGPCRSPSGAGGLNPGGTHLHAAKPKVLFVYYTYTNQTLKVVEGMSEVMTKRGFEVTLAAIDLTDKRYTPTFTSFPMRRPFLQVSAMIPTEIFRKTR